MTNKNKRTCSITGCDNQYWAKGYCGKHYQRWRTKGDPNKTLLRKKGRGSISRGYHLVTSNGESKFTHVRIAENVLGRPLKVGECVHHFDGNGLNNDNPNLLICPNQGYHMLIHQRQRAMDACGNPNWRSCRFCYQYDSPDNLYIKNKNCYHTECRNAYKRKHYAENKQEAA